MTALDNLRVVDMGTGRAGPFAIMCPATCSTGSKRGRCDNGVPSSDSPVLGACVVLFHRGSYGRGQRIWTLAGVSAFMQAGELARYPSRPPARVGGRDHTGDILLDRFYRVADGWVRIAADNVDAAALEAAGFHNATAGDTERALSAGLKDFPRDEVVRRLTAAKIPATPARQLTEPVHDQQLTAHEVLHTHHRPDGSAYCTAGRFAAFGCTQRRDVLESPRLGQHTREVLPERKSDAVAYR